MESHSIKSIFSRHLILRIFRPVFTVFNSHDMNTHKVTFFVQEEGVYMRSKLSPAYHELLTKRGYKDLFSEDHVIETSKYIQKLSLMRYEN